ncbi:MAG: DNA-directed RNA polymerase subunit P [Candidatus Thermoplasmatota archaeon]|nr:DNA-directed RNA polymerase subunit P [Candidatus Thermoplasmatota archaeon]
MAAQNVDYRCAKCGSVEEFSRTYNGISCKACGSRIFAKLRRSGFKVLPAE